jgi:N-acetylglucosaminyldiphosphoundecaprenol N-acetyl-beta-D-mannosaminyltransferase
LKEIIRTKLALSIIQLMTVIAPDISTNTDSILGIKCVVSYDYFLDRKILVNWIEKSESRYICCINAHMLVIARESREFRNVIISADLITLDGRPVFWLVYMKNIFYYFLGYSPLKKHRILQFCGRDVMEETIKLASVLSFPIGFYGNKKEVLDSLISKIKADYPNIQINYVFSPPYRPLSPQEDMEIVSAINKSNIRVLLVSLGCPKQEHWMHDKKNRVQAVMIGVGGAFEVISNFKLRPPKVVQKLGFEWFFRLLLEPNRLIFRNLYYGPKFILILLTRIIVKLIRHLLSKFYIRFNASR